jgi:hypothetical protein
MSAELITEPRELISSVTYSYWVAAHNKIIFQWLREDYAVTNIVNAGGKPKLTLGAHTISVGDTVYFGNENGSSNYTLQEYVVFAEDATTITLTATYTAGLTSGDYINSNDDFPNYYLELAVKVGSDTYTFNYVPSNTGLVEFDASPTIKKLLSTTDSNTWAATSVKDANLFKSFYIDYTENWTSSAESATSTSTYYAAQAAVQLGENSNLVDYLMNDTLSDALFMTKFTNPTYVPNYPFDITVLSTETGLSTREVRKDINKQTVNAANTAMAASDDSVNRIMLQGSYGSTVRYVDIFIYKTVTANTYTETKTIKVNQNTLCNPVQIKWLNSLNNWEFWVFEKSQNKGIDVNNSKIITNNFSDVETATKKEYTQEKQAGEIWTLHANSLSIDDWYAFMEILTSIEVTYLYDLTNKIYHTVTVIEGTFKPIDTNNKLFDLSFDIRLPSRFIQSQ